MRSFTEFPPPFPSEQNIPSSADSKSYFNGRRCGGRTVGPVGACGRSTATRTGSSGTPWVVAAVPRRFCPPISGAETSAKLVPAARIAIFVAIPVGTARARTEWSFAVLLRPHRHRSARAEAPLRPHYAPSRRARARPGALACVRRAAGFFCFVAGE